MCCAVIPRVLKREEHSVETHSIGGSVSELGSQCQHLISIFYYMK